MRAGKSGVCGGGRDGVRLFLYFAHYQRTLARITSGGVSRARSVLAGRMKETLDLADRVCAVEERLQGNKS